MKPVIAPPVFEAAMRMASACAPTRLAAAMFGSRKTAAFCICLIMSSSSFEAVTLFTPKEKTWIPRISSHFLERISFRASAISTVCPGKAL